VNNRNKLRLGLALLALGLSALFAVGALVSWQGSADTPSDGPLGFSALASDKSLGVNADLSGLDPASIERSLVDMESTGFRWLRQRFPWDSIETSPGVYDWSAWDAIVAGAARHDLDLLAVLDGSPAWARAEVDTDNSLAPPAESRGFGDFVTVFATRYGDQIDYYQIWDEPNIAPHWGAREIDPAAYVHLLREGSIRIRAADTDAVILLAALAPNVEAGGENMSDELFLDAVYREGAAEWFDLVAAQPYAFESPINAEPDAGQLNWRRVELLRDVMESHGDTETATWAVASGVPVTEATVVSEATLYARKEWPWMGPMLWAAWVPDDIHGRYALLDENGRRTPAFDQLQAIALAPERAWPGVYAADHSSGLYQGDWRVTPLGADIGRDGDRLTIPFHGTRLDLVVRRGDYRAFLFITVDGEPATDLPIDTRGQAYVVLYDPLHQMDTVTLARGLADGDHIAEIEAERGWGQWAIGGWSVSRETSSNPLWLSGGLMLVAVVAFGVSVLAAWPSRRWILLSASRLVARYRELDERMTLALTAVVAIVLYVMVGTLPVLVTLGVLALLLLLRPDVGLPLIAVSLPFHQLGRPMLGKVFSMVEILLVLTAVGWGANWLLARWTGSAALYGSVRQNSGARAVQGAARLTALDWGVIALVAVAAASLLWAEHGREAAREFRTVVLEAGVFYGLLRSMLASLPGRDAEGQTTWRVVDAWVLGGTLIALVGLGQWIFGENLITAEGVGRVRGFYGSPNNLALYLGRVLPLVVAIAAWGQSGRRRWAYLLASLLMAGALFLTYSRGAWIVGVPASMLLLAALRGRRTLLAAIGVLLVAAVVILVLVGAGRLTALLDTDSGTTFFRLQLWRSSLAMIQDHPFLGVGLDNFLYAYRSSYVLPTAWAEFDLSHPHNFVFDFWLRLGIVGLLAIIWLLVAFYRTAWAAYRRVQEGDLQLLVLGLMAGMVSFIAHGLVDNAFFLVDLAFVFVFMLAVVQSVSSNRLELAGA
jgi:O-antigen ligase